MQSLSVDCKFRIKSSSFVGESTVPESLGSILHPDSHFSPELSFIDLLELLGVSVIHEGHHD